MLIQRKNRTSLGSEARKHDDYPLITIEVEPRTSPGKQHEIQIMDINNAGMGITCDVMLKVGQKILFSENQTEWELPEGGTVMWTFKANDGFRAGIKFT